MKKSNKTVAVTLRFWTNGLPEKVGNKNELTPAWDCGMVIIEGNKEKGIKAFAIPFNNLDDSKTIIQRILAKSGIVLVENINRTLRGKK